MSIRNRLLITYLLITALGTSVLALYSWQSFRAYFRESILTDLAGRNLAVSDSIGEALAEGNSARVRHLVAVNTQQEGIKLRVIAPDGRLLATSSIEQDQHLLDWSHVPGVAEGLRGEPLAGLARGIFAQGDRYYDARPVRRHGQLLGVVRLSLTLDQFRRRERANLFTVLSVSAVTFLLCAGVSLVLARSFATPIRVMRNFAQQVGAGRFERHTELQQELKRRDELGELAEELCHMGEKLASLDAERRTFLANVAHELRTPVTNVEVALHALEGTLEEVEPAGPAVEAGCEAALRVRFLHAAEAELARLRNLVQDLLELGRLEAGVLELERQAVSLQDLVAQTVRALAPRLAARELSITQKVPQVTLAADPERLTQVLMNLLDNAIRYSAPGTMISVTGKVEGKLLTLEVQDRGAGIPDAELERIFERFYVADPSRAGAGTGLGLAIARRIVQAHGGQLRARNSTGHGATFVIELPISG